ncbi:MAG: hypothetical protein M3442_10360, partial [Chloroflexota bacterium]|nr:hypothetical protein [Chloroflexota bacterium]
MSADEGDQLRFALRLRSAGTGVPLRWDVDLDAWGIAGWIDPDSWVLRHGGVTLPLHVETDTLDGRRHTLRFRTVAEGEHEVDAECRRATGAVPPLGAPPACVVPLIGAGEAVPLGSGHDTSDLHGGLQTSVDAVDWFGRGQTDLLVTWHLHEGGAYLYSATSERDAGGRPVFRRQGRVPGIGDDRQSYNGRVRAVDLRRDGRFDLLECRGSSLLRHRNTGAVGDPRFAAPVPLPCGGAPADFGRIHSLCPADLGDGRVSLIAGTNDWSDYWPADVSTWAGAGGYRPYDEQGRWRGGPLRGRLFLLRSIVRVGASEEDADFAAPEPLLLEDGTPLEVYGTAGPEVIPATDAALPFDLVVADFLDRLWYFRCTGLVDGVPRFRARTPLRLGSGQASALDRFPGPPPLPPVDYPPPERLPDELVLPTCMHAVKLVRWAGGATDFVVGAEDGYLRAMRWEGRTADGVPVVSAPARLQEGAAHLSVGAKACPSVFDWDGDGTADLVVSNAAGQALLVRNQGSTADPRYAAPEPIIAGGVPLWVMAGPPGTIQGPSEVKWGYLNTAAVRWPGDGGGPALVAGDALGRNLLLRHPLLRSEGVQEIHELRNGRAEPLRTRWRCRPQLVDWGGGEPVYVQVDADGLVRQYQVLPDGPGGEPRVAALEPLLLESGAPLRLDKDTGGHVGRVKLAAVDWDGDGLVDLLAGNAIRAPRGSGSPEPGTLEHRAWERDVTRVTIWWCRNVGAPGRPRFAPAEPLPLEVGSPGRFGGHSATPAPCVLSGEERAGGRPD